MELITFAVGCDSKSAENACKSLWVVNMKDRKKLFRVGVFDENGNLVIDNAMKKVLPQLNASDFEWNGKHAKKILAYAADKYRFGDLDDIDVELDKLKTADIGQGPVDAEKKPKDNGSIGLIPIFAKNKNKKKSVNFEFDLDSYSVINNEAKFGDENEKGDTEWIDMDEVEFDLCSLASASVTHENNKYFENNQESQNVSDNFDIPSPKGSTRTEEFDSWSVISSGEVNNIENSGNTGPISFKAALLKKASIGPNVNVNKPSIPTPASKSATSKVKKTENNSSKQPSFVDDYFENKHESAKKYMSGRKR